MMQGKIPVFLGVDPHAGPCNATVIAVAEFEDEGDITINIKFDGLKEVLEHLVELNQLRGFALNVAYMAPAAKKENDNGRT
jgi:hypothetical protein